MRRPRAFQVVALALSALVVLGAAGCTGDGSSSARTPAPAGKSKLYVALGGDDVYGGRRRLTTAWPQHFFRDRLPINATFVNLASPRHGVSEIERDQVSVAVRLHPDLATITVLDDLERGTDPVEVERDLVQILGRLRAVDGLRVLVGTVPPGVAAPADAERLNAAVVEASRVGGGEVVDLSGVDATDPERRATQIAGAFGRVYAAPP